MPDLTLTPLAASAFLATAIVMALAPGPDMVLIWATRFLNRAGPDGERSISCLQGS